MRFGDGAVEWESEESDWGLRETDLVRERRAIRSLQPVT